MDQPVANGTNGSHRSMNGHANGHGVEQAGAMKEAAEMPKPKGRGSTLWPKVQLYCLVSSP